MNVIAWLEQSWLIIAGVIGGITLLWNFINKTLKEISESINKPIIQVNTTLQAVIESDNLIKEALLTMQRKSLLDSCGEYLARGSITLNELETLTSQYDSYHALGGNCFVTGLVEDVRNLPIEIDTKN